ncbi:unnamed protein product [Prunus armeniaca]|uniref:Uncharacterized protein n=1 Tax=Prunus armeniaca TaxID=36596 RepID=A0A6J5Y666_PRUAR|nr:unnamed protein product [Prunus armeniaca]CAB4321409.1 unnamed protein product [Prunus armeniaca]
MLENFWFISCPLVVAAYNPGLCGHPLESCQKKSKSVVRVFMSNDGNIMMAAADEFHQLGTLTITSSNP